MILNKDPGDVVVVLRDRELVVEAEFERAGFEFLGVIDAPLGAVAEMPFTDEAGGVAVLLQKRGDRGARGLDEERVEGVGNAAMVERRAPAVASGEKRITRRCADGGRRVGFGKAPALARESVKVRRANERGVGAVGTETAVAIVIGEDHDDVGRGRSGHQAEGEANKGERG